MFLILLTSFQCPCKRDVIGVLQLGAEGEAAGEAGHSNAEGGDKAAKVHGGLLAFKIGIGGQDNLFDRVVLESGKQFPGTDIVGADALGGGDSAVEDVVKSFIDAGMFQRQDVLRLLHNADLGDIALGIAADRAGVGLGDVTARRAEIDPLL